MSRDWHDMSALDLGDGIEAGAIDALALAEYFLERIARLDPDQAIYLRTTAERARAEAEAARARARAGLRRGPLDGVPISWKDLYDTAGIITAGGSALLADRVPAHDALVLERASRAGTVCLGKTNLTEFAYSGLGINPTTGTPANAFDDETPRCPGGSSSGAAVSVARGLAPAAIGSDTGGSVRVPAAWNGLVGLKTTIGLVPTNGVLPLSQSLDTVGPLTRDVADANAILGLLLNRRPADLSGADLRGTRFLVAATFAAERTAPGVRRVFEAALDRLTQAGASLVHGDIPEFDQLDDMIGGPGDIQVCEACANWGDLIETDPGRVYRPIAERVLAGREHRAVDMVAFAARGTEIRARYLQRAAEFSAVLTPTVMTPPPPIAPLEAGGADYLAANMDALGLTRLGNRLGLCGLTLPCGLDELGLPVGLMLNGLPGADTALLRLGSAIERALSN